MILLNGEKFAREAGALTSRFELLHIPLKVSASELSVAILSAAVLANERAGNITLRSATAKSFFGLRTTNTLDVGLGGNFAAFPNFSLESRIRPLVEAKRGANYQVSGLVHDLLIEDSKDVWKWTIGLAQGGLVNRNILAVEENKHLGGFVKTSRYRLPEAMTRQVAQYPLDYVNLTLGETARMRPQIWQTLREQIEKGLASRREAPDHDNSDRDIGGSDNW